jgi:hypothetical protein
MLTPYRLVITTEGSYLRNVSNYFPVDTASHGLPKWPLFLKMFFYQRGSSLISNSRTSYCDRVAPFMWFRSYLSSPVSTTRSCRHHFVCSHAALGVTRGQCSLIMIRFRKYFQITSQLITCREWQCCGLNTKSQSLGRGGDLKSQHQDK